jgi:DNA-binding LacI/PurR family transcriptional regulator
MTTVAIGDIHGMYDMIERLLSLGHRKVFHIKALSDYRAI